MSKKLGAEYGNLAGLDPEQALKYVLEYSQNLEDQLQGASSGGEKGDDEDDDPNPLTQKKPDSRDVARQFNQATKQPLGAEFVGRRESARRKARVQLEGIGYDWNELEDLVETVMSEVPAEQQTNPNAWVEAFVYVHGRAEAAKRAQGVQDGDDDQGNPSPPRTEQGNQGYSQTQVRQGNMNADRGNRTVSNQNRSKPRIEDPVERRTKDRFEKVLGYSISDEEWVALRDEENEVNTQEGYDQLQKRLNSKGF